MRNLFSKFCRLFSTNYSDKNSIGENTLKIYSTAFDKELLSDEIFQIKESVKIDFIQNELLETQQKPLIYIHDNDLYWGTVVQVLNKKSYNNNEKLQYLRDLISDKPDNFLSWINKEPIQLFVTSEEAMNLVEGTAQQKLKKIQDSEEYQKCWNAYLDWRVRNHIPNTVQLVDEYFNNNQNNNNFSEGCYINFLVEEGESRKALNYLIIILNRDKFKYSLSEDYNKAFEKLVFSNDSSIAKEARNLVFDYVAANITDTSINQLAYYLDSFRFTEVCYTWLKHYSKMDSSEYLINGGSPFLDFLYSNAEYLGNKYGKELWGQFYEYNNYWSKVTNMPFAMRSFRIFECAFSDESSEVEEKKYMLSQFISLWEEYNFRFNDSDYFGSYNSRYIRLIKQIYPDLRISKEEFESLLLGNILEYSYPLDIPLYLNRVVPFSENIHPSEINALKHDLQSLVKQLDCQNRSNFGQLENYRITTSSSRSSILNFLTNNNLIIWFDCESSDIPTNYLHFYKNNFQNALEKINIFDINVNQIVSKLQEDKMRYEIFVSSDCSIFTYEYEEHLTDWYTPQRLVKMLNLTLLKKESTNRFIQIDSEDQSAIFCLASPDILCPLLDKYTIKHWAVQPCYY